MVKMQNETLLTISERTGFSASTVSRVLSGQAEKYRISSRTIELIKNEAERCNYAPSILAQGLRTNKTKTIGFLIPSIENPYFANMANTVIREAKSYGYTVVLVDTMENEDNESQGIASLLSRKVDGILLVPCGRNPAKIEAVNRNDVPVVLIDRYYKDTELSYVCTNNFLGGLEATRYLLSQGHRRIVCIQGTPYSMPVIERDRGYTEALEEIGLGQQAHIAGKDFSIQNGYLETKLALSSTTPPTAVFTQSNTILLGAIKAIRESGLKIPDDISIISFDNNTFLDFLDPAITRVSQPVEEIGILSVKILLQSIDNHSNENTQLQLPPRLIVCNSVKTI